MRTDTTTDVAHALVGSDHYTCRERSQGSAVIVGLLLAVLAITAVTYGLAVRAAD